MRLGIIAALSAEAKCLSDWPDAYDVLDISHPFSSQPREKTLLSISGIGPKAARATAHNLVKHGATALLSWGCAGALVNELKPGDLLIPKSIYSEDHGTLHPHKTWRKRLTDQLTGTLQWHEGILVESSRILTNIEEKQAMAKAFNAIAVDMESAAIGRVAEAADVPFMVIRSIADTANEGLPSCIAEAMNSRGNIRMQHLLSALIRQPGLWPQLFRLRQHFQAASRTLKTLSEQSHPLFYV